MKTRQGWQLRGKVASPVRQRGASVVLMAVSLFMLLAFTALAVDGSNLYVARNELQNAADAGALAGARMLYLADGSAVNPNANQAATEVTTANESQGNSVEIVSIQRGHWSFTNGTFTANPSLEAVDLFGKSTMDLDLDPNFINAVEVVTERSATPVAAFFGGIFGFTGYEVSARAVAYIGFAGTLRPGDVDQPIAMCQEAITTPTGEYSCDVGRFIPEGDQTGGWTDLEQGDDGASNANDLRDLVENGTGNPEELEFGEDISTNNGQVQAAFQAFYDKWVVESDTKTKPWNMSLPVVDCSDGIAPGNPLVGAVNLDVIWVVNQSNKIDDDAPTQMALPPDDSDGVSPGTWSNADPSGVTRWDDFVGAMNLRGENDALATYANDGWRQKSIYFLPSCSYQEPTGGTGGENYGILAQIPVLVD
ncbi:Tad domain-containing protein [Halomonas salinarum]|uniref:Tad domain-containing protein n=1 Tax=Halomonas salinarum TaxID=1158993 RepID=UPI00143C8AC0|nr:Tad domain-containing protein [Halomonas salinarum]